MTQLEGQRPRVLRFAHHGVVAAWRERERELVRSGVDLTLVSARRWNEGGTLIALDAGADDFVVGVDTLGSHPNGFVYDPRAVWRLLDREWDLIDLHEEPCATQTAEILAMLRLRGVRAPVLLYSAQNIPKRYPVPIRWLERYALRRAAGAYVCNAEAGRILQAKGMRAQPAVIGLGTDLEVFSPDSRTEPGSPLLVGYSGRLESHKGVDVLLKAIARVPSTRLLLAGSGPQRPELERLASELGVSKRVDFIGHLDSGLADFYRQLDVLVVPSLPTPGWLEQFGRVVVEAMASGAPVIASRSGALPEVIGPAGIVVEPNQPGEIAAALTELTEPRRWRELRAAGLDHCRQYSWKAVALEHRALIDQVLATSAAGRDVGTAAAEDGAEDARPAHPEVVIVAYGPAEKLAPSLQAVAGLSVTVVDNSSSEATRRLVEAHGAEYLDPGVNLGFAAGVNHALAYLIRCGRDHADVLLLNPDATVSRDGVVELARRLHAEPGIACVAPRQTAPDSDQPDRVEWPFPSPLGAWLTAVGLGAWDRGHTFLIGSILLLNAAALRDVGEFDERFFLYAEETDWQRRAVTRGWRSQYVPSVTGSHVGAGTSSDESTRLRYFHSSQLAYARKHYGRGGELLVRAAAIFGAAVRGVLKSGREREYARWRLRFYLTAPCARS